MRVPLSKLAILTVMLLTSGFGSVVSAQAQIAANVASPVRLAQQGDWFTDPQGRVVMPGYLFNKEVVAIGLGNSIFGIDGSERLPMLEVRIKG